jgi:hypothetical protein
LNPDVAHVGVLLTYPKHVLIYPSIRSSTAIAMEFSSRLIVICLSLSSSVIDLLYYRYREDDRETKGGYLKQQR